LQQDTFEIKRSTSAIGAELHGFEPFAPSAAEVLKRLVGQHGVICIRDTPMSPEQEIRLASQLGSIVPTPQLRKIDGFPLIEEVRKTPVQARGLGDVWHTDQSFRPRPPRYTVLFAKELPPVGGDTLFASMAAAYDALSEQCKASLSTLQALHVDCGPYGNAIHKDDPLTPQTRHAVHPVVITLPGSERRSLYLSPDKTWRFDGWTNEESEGLLNFLLRFVQRPEFTVRYRWRPGTALVWDNYQTWHYAVNDYAGHTRVMHRMMVDGDPFA